MDQEIKARLDAQDEALKKIYVSVEKNSRKYFLWTMIGTVIAFVLPLIGILAALPSFINIYTTGLGGL